jgi:hypothetical protein
VATVQRGTCGLSALQVDALESAADGLPDKWRLVIVGDAMPDGGFDVTIEGPGIFAVRTFSDGNVASALMFLEDFSRRRRE